MADSLIASEPNRQIVWPDTPTGPRAGLTFLGHEPWALSLAVKWPLINLPEHNKKIRLSRKGLVQIRVFFDLRARNAWKTALRQSRRNRQRWFKLSPPTHLINQVSDVQLPCFSSSLLFISDINIDFRADLLIGQAWLGPYWVCNLGDSRNDSHDFLAYSL